MKGCTGARVFVLRKPRKNCKKKGKNTAGGDGKPEIQPRRCSEKGDELLGKKKIEQKKNKGGVETEEICPESKFH